MCAWSWRRTALARSLSRALTPIIEANGAPRDIHVAVLHVGFMDTDMADFVPADQKVDPSVVAKLALDGLFAGDPEILADHLSRTVKAQLSAAPERLVQSW
jgi:NAD(P)-dependent dehydrogenase (short-subunit alcohol dehydrogenase family)